MQEMGGASRSVEIKRWEEPMNGIIITAIICITVLIIALVPMKK